MAELTGDDSTRRHVRLVLHTSHPVPGLRVDVLRMVSHRQAVNEERRVNAEQRIIAAAEVLRQQGRDVSVTAVAREANARKATVSKVLGKGETLPRLPYQHRQGHRQQARCSQRNTSWT